MKKLITMLMLCFFASAIAQDGYNQSDQFYQNIKSNIFGISEIESRKIGDLFADKEYLHTRTTATSLGISHIYTHKASKKRSDNNNLIISFLDKNGRYDLSRVHCNCIHNIWIDYFLPTATLDNLEDNYRYSDIISQRDNVYIRLLDGTIIVFFRK